MFGNILVYERVLGVTLPTSVHRYTFVVKNVPEPQRTDEVLLIAPASIDTGHATTQSRGLISAMCPQLYLQRFSTMLAPNSSYSFFEIHIWWNVPRLARMLPPSQGP